MAKKEKPVLYCRFSVDGRAFSGQIRDQSVDIVEGDPFTGMSPIRLSYPIDRVKFLPPFAPKKIWCVGRNYLNHVKELNNDVPKEPLIFTKPTTAIIGSGDFIRIPSWAGRIDYEGELAVVIGKNGRNIPEERAFEHVKGYSIMNDVTARDLQKNDGQWTRAKGFDTFAPFGPALLLTQEIPLDASIRTIHNGKIVQESTFDMMIFSIPRIISHISRFATLEEGDVIATGTPGGIGPMKVGDLIEVEIEGIGKLRNICSE
ncbi:fumarylacetoacetate hydrolase family protein [Synergistaceae bacterium OttesenSCG-928-D05]|nr:fumarylacetoacetate hydrolase family protein [Synergistaceae bacterium OttesenSCG-928-D05]